MRKISSLLSRAAAHTRRHTRAHRLEAPFRRKVLVEALEPRLLLSADVLPGAALMATASAPAPAPQVLLSPQVAAVSTPVILFTPVGASEAGAQLALTESGLTDEPVQAQSFALSLAAGQTLSIIGRALDSNSGLPAGVALELLAPDGSLVIDASGLGEVNWQGVVAPASGTYTLTLTTVAPPQEGPLDLAWNIQAALDAVFEAEAYHQFGSSNSTPSTAQAVEAGRLMPLLTLPQGSRTAVVGRLTPDESQGRLDTDLYQLSLTEGELLQLDATLAGSSAYLQLLDGEGRVVANSVRTTPYGGATPFYALGIPEFRVDRSGTYFVKVELYWDSGRSADPIDYTLAIARNISLDPDNSSELGLAPAQLAALQPPIAAESASAGPVLQAASASAGAAVSYTATSTAELVAIDVVPIADGSNPNPLAGLSVEVTTEAGVPLPILPGPPPEGQDGWRFLLPTPIGERLTITVRADSGGQFLLRLDGAVGEDPAPTVTSSTLDDGLASGLNPYQSVWLSEAVRADLFGDIRLLDASGEQIASLQPFSYSGNGNGVGLRLPDGLAEGTYRLEADVGALQDLTGQPLAAFSVDFTVDNRRPQLVSSTPADGQELPSAQTITLQFDEPMATNYWPSPTFYDDQGLQTDLAWSYQWSADGQVLTISLYNVPQDSAFEMRLPSWALQDVAGNEFDALAATPEIDGFSLHFGLDQSAYVLPAFGAREPAGALAYTTGMDASLASASDVDEFLFEMAAGSSFVPVLSPRLGQASSTLPQLTLEVVAPDGSTVAMASSGDAGRPLMLADAVQATIDGTWRLRVSSPAGGVGDYAVSVVRGAGVQREFVEVDGALQPSNGTRDHAEDLEASTLVLAPGIDRMASVGRFSPGINPATGAVTSDIDYFRFTLEAGQSASVVMAVSGDAAVSNLRMGLFDDSGDLAASSGQLVGAAIVSPGADRVILDYTNHSDQTVTLYARPRADTAARYTLVVTRGATFDVGEINRQPQTLGPTGAVLGALTSNGGSGSGGAVAVPDGSPASQLFVNDGSGFYWDADYNGTINNGTSDAYDGGLYLRVGDSESGFDQDFSTSRGVRSNDGRTLALQQDSVNRNDGLQLNRKITVPANDGYARFLDQITNNGSQAKTVTLALNTNLGSDGGTNLIATDSGGSTVFDTTDHWLVTDDVNGQYDPSMAHVIWGEGGLAPDRAGLSGDNLSSRWTVTVQPGQTVSFLHFAVQASNQATARATAERLVALPPDVLTGLSAGELASIVNFSTGSSDAYRFYAQAGDVLSLGVTAVGDSPLPFVLRLLDPAGQLVLDTGLANGPVSGLGTGTLAASTGAYTVQVLALGTVGEYLLQVDGATGTPPAPQVLASTPANDRAVAGTPAYIDVSFDQFIRPDSAQADDLMLDDAAAEAGLAVTRVEALSGRTLRFHLNGAALGDGRYGWALAEGALSAHDGQGNAAYAANFVVDNIGPQVLYSTPSSVSVPFNQLSFEFSEALDASSVALDDVVAFTDPDGTDLRSRIGSIVVDGSTATLSFSNQFAVGRYSLTLGPNLRDLAGNAMDQDGDGVKGEALDDAYTAVVDVGQPDLVVDEVLASATLLAGTSASFSWTVRNQGSVNLPPNTSWYDAVYLVAEDGTTTLLDQIYHSTGGEGGNNAAATAGLAPLAATDGYTTTVQLLVPLSNSLPPGNYRVQVVVDVYGQLIEDDDTNNARTTEAVSVLTAPAVPDLVVAGVTVPAEVPIGSSFTLNWTTSNQGTGAFPSYSYERIELVDAAGNLVRINNSTAYATDQYLGALAANQSVARSLGVVLPASLPDGQYRLRITTDFYGYVTELAGEANNVTLSDLFTAGRQDLRPVSVTAPSSATMGDAVTVSWTVENIGVAAATGYWYDRIELVDRSTQQVAYAVDDYRLHDVGSNGSYTASRQFTLPTNRALANGAYDVRVSVDFYSQRSERNETNNVLLAATPLTVLVPALPDLQASAIVVADSVAANTPLTVSWTSINSGSANAGGYYDRLYLEATNGTLTILTDSYQGSGLAAGASLSRTVDVTVPAALPPGTYRVRVDSDIYGYLTELAGEDNNTARSGPLTVTTALVPDLQLTSITVPEGITMGSNFTLGWTGLNHGTASTPANAAWYERVELVNAGGSTVYETSAYVNPGAVAPDGSYSGTATLNIPLNYHLPEGSYSVRLTSNYYNGYLTELNKADNTLTALTRVALVAPPTPDLVPANIVVPSQPVPANTRITVTWDERNAGDAATSQGYYTYVDLLASNGSAYYSAAPYFDTPANIAPGETVVRSHELLLPTSLPPGPYTVRIRTDIYGQIEEYDQENNNSLVSGSFTVTEALRADLTNVRLTTALPASAVLGGSLTVAYAVDNSGPGSTQNVRWVDRVQLVRADNPSVVLAYADVNAGNGSTGVGVGGSYSNSVNLALPLVPSNLAGNYLVQVRTDIYNYLNESDRADNGLDTGLALTVPALANLVAGDVSVAATATSGQPITVSWVTRNTGNGPLLARNGATTPVFNDTIYLATTSGVLLQALGSYSISAPFDAGASLSRVQSVTLPDTVANGDYLIVVVTDSGDNINEHTGENDNRGASALVAIAQPPRVDLQVSDVVVPATAFTGGPLVLSWTTRNSGEADFAGGFSERVQISSSPDFSTELRSLSPLSRFTGTLAAGAAVTQTAEVQIPLELNGAANTSRTWYLRVITDAAGEVYEYAFENNNTSATSTVLFQVPSLPDFVVTSVDAPDAAVAGTSVVVTYTVTNQGTVEAGARQDRISLLAEDGSTRTVQVIREVNEPLAAGASQTLQVTLQLPLNLGDQPFSGRLRAQVTVDTGNAVAEFPNEGNNSRSELTQTVVTLPPLPDLVVSSITAPLDALTESDIPVRWSLTNRGTAALNGSWIDQVYLSSDGVLSGDDLLLGSFSTEATIAAGATIERLQTVTLPRDRTGSQRLIVVTDAGHQVFEGPAGEGPNNISVDDQALVLRQRPLPNLQVSSVTPPENAFSGQSSTVSWTVRNSGDSATTVPMWTDAVYLSLDDVLDNADTLLGTATNPGYLEAGASYANSVSVTLPRGIDGFFRYIVVTDAYQQLFEGRAESAGETDNTSAPARARITLTTPPDLVVDSVNAAPGAFSGETITVNWTVSNAGEGRTRETQWYDRVWLSADSTLDNADVYLGDVIHNGALASTDGYSQSLLATLPIGISGPYHFIVASDIFNQVYESTLDNNNTRAQTLPTVITLTPPPDLEIVDAQFAESARAGAALTVRYRVENLGASDVPSRQAWWTDQAWLSLDDNLDSNDISLGTATHYGVLATEGGYDGSFTANLPPNLQGRYKLILRTDIGNAVFEGVAGSVGETNNLWIAGAVDVFVSRPDLAVTAFTVPDAPEAGRTGLFSWTVRNQGDGDTITANWSDSLWVSLDDTLGDGDDVLIGTVNHAGVLAPGVDYTVTVAPSLPFALVGNGRFYLRTDGGGQVGESNEANNLSLVQSATITRRASDLRVIDATVTPVDGNVRAFDLSYTVRNDGVATTQVNAWTDGVWLSGDRTIGAGDTRVATPYRGNPLAVGETYTVTQRIEVPGNVPAGTFKVLVRADDNNAVIEGATGSVEENNNVAVASVSIGGLPAPGAGDELPLGDLVLRQPDLVVASVDAPASAFSGQQVTLRWTVANQGVDDATNPYWWSNIYDQVYLSSDLFLDSGDLSLGFAGYQGQAAGSTVERSLTANLPVGRSGLFYVLVKADAGNRVAEPGGETNNVGYSPALLEVHLAPPADLVAGTVSLPANAAPGQSMSLTYSVNNSGSNSALGQWTDALYLSRDDVFSTDDVLFGSLVVSGPVAGGEGYSRTVQGVVPGIDPGDYRLIVRSDVRNVVAESNEANNLSASVDKVELQVPELTLGEWASGQVQAGQSLYFRVNVGEAEALRLTLDGPGEDIAHDLFVGQGSVPSRARNDAGSGDQFTPDPTVVVPSTEAGVYYVRVDASPFAGGAYRLRADLVPFSISAVSQTPLGNTGRATLRVDGARFDDNTRFALVAADGSVRNAVALSLRDAGRGYVTFDLFGAAVGTYSLRATDTNAAGDALSSTLAAAVKVIDGEGANAFLTITGPTAVQVNRVASFQLNYSNDGDADTMAPLMIVTPGAGTTVGLSAKSLSGEPLFILGSNLDGPIDLLRPGAHYSLPVAYGAPGEAGFLTVEARPIQSDSDERITDWSVIERALRPAQVNLANWQPFWARVQPTIGSTYGDLVKVLNEMAVRLSPADDPIRDVKALFAAQLAADRQWRPHSAVTGQLKWSDDASAIAAQTVSAYALVNGSYTKVGSALTDAQGRFTLGGLKAGELVLTVENAAVDQDRDGAEDSTLPSFTLASHTDTNAGDLFLRRDPTRQAAIESLPVFASDSAGQTYMAWIKEDTLWVARRDGDQWVDAQRLVQDSVSQVAMVASTRLLDGSDPGVLVSWVMGEGNQAELFIAVGRVVGGQMQWSSAVQLTDDAVADSLPRLDVDADGRVTIVYLKEDASIRDDTDLYAMRLSLSAASLVFAAPAAAAPAALNGNVSAESTSFTGSWEIWKNDYLIPLALKGEVAIEAGIDGCDYNASITGGINFEAGSDMPGPTDSAFSSNLKVGLKGNIKAQASWSADIESQDWKFNSATASVNATGEFSWGNGLLILLEKFGPGGFAASRLVQTGIGFVNRFTPLTITNGVKGSLGVSFEAMKWNDSPPTENFRAPDDWGKTTFSIGAGAWLRATQDGVNDAKVEVSANLSAELTVFPKLGGKFGGDVQIEAEYKWMKWTGKLDLFSFSSSSSDLMAQSADSEETTFTIDPTLVIGTGAVYGDNAMFGAAAAAGDLFSDGAVALARTADGTLTATWSRTVDPAAGINTDELRTAAYVNGEWVQTGVIAGADGFISGLRVATDADGRLVAVWTREDNNGTTGYDSFEALNTARDRADIWYSVRGTDGQWSTAQALSTTAARDIQATLGVSADGHVLLAWVAATPGDDTLYSARFNGLGFDSITSVAVGQSLADAAFVAVGSGLELYWSQDRADTLAVDPTIRFASYNGNGWSGNAGFSYTLSPATAAAVAASAASTSLGALGLAPSSILPAEPVPEDCLKCTPEKLKKITEAAPDCRPGGGSSTSTDLKKCEEKTITYAPCVVRPRDPNDILGPDGYGDALWTKASEVFDYTIRFENAADASAPAQVVTVTQTLDADLDARSFRVTGLGFADVEVTPTQSRSFYSGRIDLRESQGIYVDVAASIDTTTRQLTFTFTTIDPETGQVPVDATLGFLLPNDSSGRGDGFVSYSVKAVRGVATGAVVDAQARIVFDSEGPIDTPPIFNTLDTGVPSSSVAALPSTTEDSTFTVNWSGTDASNGSGIRDYEVYVSTDGGDFTLWQLATTDTEALFEGAAGHRYAFYSVARDNAGNVEAAPAAADTEIRVLARTGSVAGTVFNDINFNGQRDEGEGALAGWSVFIDADTDGVRDADELSATTAADGSWLLADVLPGAVRVTLDRPAGYEVTSPVAGYIDLAITAGTALTGRDFAVGQLGSISGVQFDDTNGNGARDAGEQGLAGWTLFLDQDADGQLDAGEASTVTAADGSYRFDDLRPGAYQVAQVMQDGWIQTRPAVAGTQAAGSTAFAVTLSGSLASISLPACACGGTITTVAAQQAGWDEELVELDQFRADPGFAGVDGSGIRVVVIDTGIDSTHPFFDGRIVYQYDFADNDAVATDNNGHGTHVAGVIAGADPMFGGVAPGAELIVLKVFGDDGSGSFRSLEQALQWVLRNADAYRIGVVNLSLGDGGNWTDAAQRYGLGDEFAALAARNIISVAAAGNNYATTNALGVAYPANDPAVLAVGAVWAGDFGGPWRFGNGGVDEATGADHIASFSQRDPDQTDIFAPGARLTSAAIGGGVRTMQGTSQSAAYVSGVAALAQQLAQQHLGRSLSVAEFRDLLVSTAVSINDGDDERDNVANTGLDFPRLDVKRLADALIAMGGTTGGNTGGNPGTPAGGGNEAPGTPVGPATGNGLPVMLTPGQQVTDADFGVFHLGSVGGVVFDDRNANGQRDDGEAGLAGATVFVDVNGNGQADEGETTVSTDADGHWALNNLLPGSLTVAEVLPAGWSRGAGVGSHTLTITSGLSLATLDFARHDIAPEAQDDSAETVAGRSVSGNVLDNDSDPGRTDNSLLSVALVSGPAHGLLQLDANGGFTYTPTDGYEGSDSFRYSVSDGATAQEAMVRITVRHDVLVVQQLSGRHDGAVVTFSRPIATSGLDVGGAAADIVVTDAAGRTVAGSVFVAADGRSLRFLASGGLLADGVYHLQLRAGAQALRDTAGVALNGDGDPVNGSAYLAQFTVARGTAVSVGLADTARGAGQVLGQTASDTSLAVRLSEGAGITRVSFTLAYDPALLGVATLARGTGLPAGASFSAVSDGAGRINVSITFASGLPAGAVTLAQLVATVPTTAAYGAAQVLDVQNLLVNGGAIAALDDDAVHVAAYSGDIDRDRSLSAGDVALMRSLLATGTGQLAQWPLIDIGLLGDVNGSGRFDGTDALRLEQALAGATGLVPPVPGATPPVVVVPPPPKLPALPKPLPPKPLPKPAAITPTWVAPLVSPSATIDANTSIRVTL